MEHDKSDLIKQLHIDKHQRHEPIRTKAIFWTLLCLLSGLLGGGAVYLGSGQSLSSDDNTARWQEQISEIKRLKKQLAAQVNDEQEKPKPARLAKSAEKKILDASGYVTARRVATVSAKVLGLITEVNVEEGMRVENNQVLARIDDKAAQVNLKLAKARVETQQSVIKRLKVELTEAERVLSRLVDLEKAGNFSSRSEQTKARSAVDQLIQSIVSAKADLKVAHLQIRAHEITVNDHVIRAPYSGVVTAKNAQAGEIVSPSSAGGGFTRTGICTIVDMDSLEVEVDVNEAYIGRVESDQKVIAVLDAYPQWKIPASVIAIIPTADRAKATVRVRIKLEQRDAKILPDMSVKVSFYSS